MDKSKLLADRISMNTEDVEIDGVGTVTVRGLSRFEMLVAEKKHQGDTLHQERMVLAMAMVDPVMTEDDIAAWQKVSGPMEINKVAMAVNRLSGIGKDAAKSGVAGDGND